MKTQSLLFGVLSFFLVGAVLTHGFPFFSKSSRISTAISEPPAFCKGKDCPRFQVVANISDVERRRYEPAKWITTNITGKQWSEAVLDGYKQLDDYRNGNNQDKTKIEETVPYLTLFYPVAEGQVKSYYTVEYFLPFAHQENPPAPVVADKVNWIQVPQADIWVQEVPLAYPKEQDIVSQAFTLSNQLKQSGQKVSDKLFGFAQYDSVLQVINRHNEIWIFSDEKPS